MPEALVSVVVATVEEMFALASVVVAPPDEQSASMLRDRLDLQYKLSSKGYKERLSLY